MRRRLILVAAALAVIDLAATPVAVQRAAVPRSSQQLQTADHRPLDEPCGRCVHGTSVSAQGSGQPGHGGLPQNQSGDNVDVHALHVQGAVWMLVGGSGGNVTVQAGEDGVLLVDTSLSQLSDKVMAEIKKISGKPVNYIINTDAAADHVGGNEAFAKASTDFLAPPQVQIIAHENVLNRMSAPTGKQAAFPAGAWPTDTYFTRRKEVFFNNEAIILSHQPAAHSDGDTIVFFRRSDVVSTGDIFQTTTFPFIDTERGGTINGIIAALNNVLDITVPRDKQEGGTYVIPGHGRLCDEHGVLEYRDMLTIVRDRVQDSVKKGMTLAQMKATEPTLDYEARWGSAAGAQATDQFLDKIFNEMKAATR
jgi:glyoxylase-like metal-dependent hydrolase (beta-lactamase superfamily II)